jgi:hypothetical protein
MSTETMTKEQSAAVKNADEQAKTYERPEVKTLNQRDVIQAVNKGSKFPARGFAG